MASEDRNRKQEAYEEASYPGMQKGGAKAFFCEKSIFREIAELKLKSKEMTGEEVQLLLLKCSLEDFSRDEQEEYMACFKRVIAKTLRRSDAFTKLNDTQFLVLLSGARQTDMEIVVKHIREACEAECPGMAGMYRASCVEVELLKNVLR